MNDLVSIITPAYNAEKTISETIDSVLNQTMKDWEMIIVDDCSTDKTVEIVQSYMREDSRIRLIKKEENSGVAAARNIALNEAKGKYIAFLDSDDLWVPEKLTKQICYMDENQYAFTYSSYGRFKNSISENVKVIKARPIMTADRILKDTSIGCLTVMVNKEQVGCFQMPNLSHTEDNCTWREILLRGYTGHGINEVLAFYRETSNSLSSNKLKSLLLQWNTYRKYYRFSIAKSVYYQFFYMVNTIIRQFR